MMKLVIIALWSQAAWMSLASEEACKSSVEEEAGRAMMQLSGGPVRKSGTKDENAPAGNTSSKTSVKSAVKAAKSKSKAKTPDASNVALNQAGYNTIAQMCCNYEMEEYIRRIVANEDLKVCDQGGLFGIVPFYTCENAQNYSVLLAEVKSSSSGVCPWSVAKGADCKKLSKSCGVVADPMAHRRRNCGRNDNSQNLDLEMQNAATNEFIESVCGTHQQYTDVSSSTGVLKACSVKGDITENATAKIRCLNECCVTNGCIGVVVQDSGTTLQKSFIDADSTSGAVAFLHRQR